MSPKPLPESCSYGVFIEPASVPGCMELRGVLTQSDAESSRIFVARVVALRDSMRSDSATASFYKAGELTRALEHLGEFYSKGLFDDSARFDRIRDHVAATIEYVKGTLQWVNGRAWPRTTPWLSWTYYPSEGLYFQPVNTAHVVAYPIPRAGTSTDSLLQVSENLYHYALWRQYKGVRFPVWEYEFAWGSGGVNVDAPWLSGLAQGFALMLFAECHRRTGDLQWRARAYEVLNSFYVPWGQGGVLLPDTSHGYWWEEFHPTVQVWNGGAWALVAVGFFRDETGDSKVQALYERGLQAIKYYTPFYDTGAWTLYSRTQGYNTIGYHNLSITLMDILYSQTGDPWFKTTADRWRSYTPPPGVQ